MNKDYEEFEYLIRKFPHMSKDKIKEGIFIESRIKNIYILQTNVIKLSAFIIRSMNYKSTIHFINSDLL